MIWKCTDCGQNASPHCRAHFVADIDELRAENEAYRARVIADGKLFEESSELLKNTLAENDRLRTALKAIVDDAKGQKAGFDDLVDEQFIEKARALLEGSPSEGDGGPK